MLFAFSRLEDYLLPDAEALSTFARDEESFLPDAMPEPTRMPERHALWMNRASQYFIGS